MCSRLAPQSLLAGDARPAASARASRTHIAARPRVRDRGARVSSPWRRRRGTREIAPRASARTRAGPSRAPQSHRRRHDKRAGRTTGRGAARPSPATVAFEPLPDDTACVAWTGYRAGCSTGWTRRRPRAVAGGADPDRQARARPAREARQLPRAESWVYTARRAARRFTYVDEGRRSSASTPTGPPSTTERELREPDVDLRVAEPFCSSGIAGLRRGGGAVASRRAPNILVGLDLRPCEFAGAGTPSGTARIAAPTHARRIRRPLSSHRAHIFVEERRSRAGAVIAGARPRTRAPWRRSGRGDRASPPPRAWSPCRTHPAGRRVRRRGRGACGSSHAERTPRAVAAWHGGVPRWGRSGPSSRPPAPTAAETSADGRRIQRGGPGGEPEHDDRAR